MICLMNFLLGGGIVIDWTSGLYIFKTLFWLALMMICILFFGVDA
jgi:hypothetical protein